MLIGTLATIAAIALIAAFIDTERNGIPVEPEVKAGPRDVVRAGPVVGHRADRT